MKRMKIIDRLIGTGNTLDINKYFSKKKRIKRMPRFFKYFFALALSFGRTLITQDINVHL